MAIFSPEIPHRMGVLAQSPYDMVYILYSIIYISIGEN